MEPTASSPVTSWQHRVLHRVLLALSALANRGKPDIRKRRIRFERFSSRLPMPKGVQVQPVDVDGIPGEWLIPENAASNGAILYLHGGGYVMGSRRSHRHFVARLARAAGVRALLLDYRLAPEYPFPAAVQDAQTAYRWLLGRGYAPQQIILAGDSAGGGLALAALLALRAAKAPQPVAAACFSPWTDLALTGDSIRAKATVDPIVPVKHLQLVAATYLHGADAKAPLASPLYGDLHGLPPLLILVGTNEVLLDDSIRFAERARKAGVEVELDVWPEMLHVWPFFATFLPEGREAFARAGKFVREKLASGIAPPV